MPGAKAIRFPISAGSIALVPTGRPIRADAPAPGVKGLTVVVKELTVLPLSSKGDMSPIVDSVKDVTIRHVVRQGNGVRPRRREDRLGCAHGGTEAEVWERVRSYHDGPVAW